MKWLRKLEFIEPHKHEMPNTVVGLGSVYECSCGQKFKAVAIEFHGSALCWYNEWEPVHD